MKTLNYYCDLIEDFIYVNNYDIIIKNGFKYAFINCCYCSLIHKIILCNKKHYEYEEIKEILNNKLLLKNKIKTINKSFNKVFIILNKIKKYLSIKH